MGVIQGSINSLLATAGVAARLSKGLSEMKEPTTKKPISNTDTDTYEQKIKKRIAAMKAAEQALLTKQQELRGGRLR